MRHQWPGSDRKQTRKIRGVPTASCGVIARIRGSQAAAGHDRSAAIDLRAAPGTSYDYIGDLLRLFGCHGKRRVLVRIQIGMKRKSAGDGRERERRVELGEAAIPMRCTVQLLESRSYWISEILE